jgi:DNA repair protein RadD
VAAIHPIRSEQRKPTLTTCPECSAIRTSGQPCPACGWRPQRKPQHIEVIDGDLAHVSRDRRVTVPAYEKDRFFRQLLWIVRERDYDPGWAAHKFKEKFGHWPPRGNPQPEFPDPAVRSWVRSRQIAYAKARAR